MGPSEEAGQAGLEAEKLAEGEVLFGGNCDKISVSASKSPGMLPHK